MNYCLNPKTEHFAHYGGRGIGVHQSWVNDFEAFFAHIGPRPTDNHTVDRIDVNKGYEPGNVRWATHTTQMRNMRRSIRVTINGEEKSLPEWCEIFGHTKSTVYARIYKKGMPPEDALRMPRLR